MINVTSIVLLYSSRSLGFTNVTDVTFAVRYHLQKSDAISVFVPCRL